ncbi:hypothetical protein ACFFSW_17800 [Saccharothrix longispora]|uniref:Uncharacterized protein n=1 Tax=Saccharothrix longispora TaxID=33920 RepID=A0ABU1PSG3_9PSEU|nr:hypothetical protein [Saccharothrix longispora]MDR6593569.1 hypothetical protein [Saccharothrix longispora]
MGRAGARSVLDRSWRPVEDEEARGYELSAVAYLLCGESALQGHAVDGRWAIMSVTLTSGGLRLHERRSLLS